MKMMRRLEAADGHHFDCWFEEPTPPRRGGLVILQEIFGVTEQLKDVAKRYSALGYEVAIPALFDRIERGAVVSFDDIERARGLMGGMNADDCMTDIAATVGAVSAHGGKVAVMGFCWGGGLAVRAAQVLDIAGAIAFYGTRITDYLDSPLRAPVLAHFGTTDTHSPPEVVERIRAALPDLTAHFYDAGHAFANAERPAMYHAGAAELAHERSEAFLEKVLA